MKKGLDRDKGFSDALEYVVNVNILKSMKSELGKAFSGRKKLGPRKLKRIVNECNTEIKNSLMVYENVKLNYDVGNWRDFLKS